jgi:glycosyltransferase involved in cell wall biosynthesis
MKIVLVHNSYQEPGGEDVVFRQERQMLENSGRDVVVYQRTNAEILNLPALERATLLKRSIWASDTFRDFSNLLKEHRPDVVHVHNTFFMISPSVYGACQEHGVPVVQTLHNFRFLCPAATFFRDGKVCEECVDHTLLNGVFHGCYRNSRPATALVSATLAWHRAAGTYNDRIDRYIALTNSGRDKFIASGFPSEKISVKPNFVDPDPGERERPGANFVFVGRLSPEKGLTTLLDAWKKVPSDLRLLIVGDGPERTKLEHYISTHGISRVELAGRLSREKALDAIKSARALIMPSLWYETFGMCIVEAFACGTPVICSRLGAMQDLVTDGRTGTLFEPGNAEDLLDKIEWAASHASELEAMGHAARQEYLDLYTGSRNRELLMGIYEQAVAQYA